MDTTHTKMHILLHAYTWEACDENGEMSFVLKMETVDGVGGEQSYQERGSQWYGEWGRYGVTLKSCKKFFGFYFQWLRHCIFLDNKKVNQL